MNQELSNTKILRLVGPKLISTGDDNGNINFLALRPSSKELEMPPVRVSVWDVALTTISQAREISEKRDYLPFLLSVDDVRQVGQQNSVTTMRVVYDKLPAPDCDKPGADGHSGIEGLEKQPNEGTVRHKGRLRELVRLLVPYNE